jgi:hypothetical protein
MKRNGWILLALGSGCQGSDKDSVPGKLIDDTDGGDVECVATLLDIDLEDGEADVYYRKTFDVVFTDPVTGSLSATLTGSDGTEIAASVTLDETGYNAVIDPGPMVAEETYAMDLDVCGELSSFGFTTSIYGGDLIIEPVELVGNTYLFDLGTATYKQPEGLGMIIGLFLSAPLLVGITEADASEITLLGAQGWVDDETGEYNQSGGLASWDFGVADFTDQPWFWVQTDQINIDYDGYDIPIYDFEIQGTFEPDGNSIGGASALGLADTRNMGPLLDLDDDPSAVCDYGAGFGLVCEPCPDEGEYCLTIEAWFVACEMIEDLTLVVIE